MALPDLALVSVFVKVVELESFTLAATALALPKSSVSRSIAHLEEGLGVRLLQRTSRKLSLTDAGRAFYERVREPLSGVVDAMTDAAESSRGSAGIIRFTAPQDMGSSVLAGPIAEFVRNNPQIKIDVTLTNRLVDMVQERFDLALRATRKLDDSSLVARRVTGGRNALFATTDYLQRRGKPKTLADLADHDFVVFRGHEGRTTLKLLGPDGEAVVPISGSIIGDDLGFVRRVILEGGGIGLLPLFMSDPEIERVLPDYSTEGGTLFLVMPSGRHIPGRVTLFRDFLLERLKDDALFPPRPPSRPEPKPRASARG